MKQIAKCLLAGSVVAILLAGCGGSGSDSPPATTPPVVSQSLQSLKIVSGSGDMSAGWTLELAPQRIHYRVDAFAGAAASQFTAALSADDLARMSTLVNAQELASKLALPNTAHAPCRAGDLQIAIGQGNVVQDFRIPGTQRCGSAVQPGLNELLDLATQLIQKYRPAP